MLNFFLDVQNIQWQIELQDHLENWSVSGLGINCPNRTLTCKHWLNGAQPYLTV